MRLFPQTALLALLSGLTLAPAEAQTSRPARFGSFEGLWELPSAIPEGFVFGELPGALPGAAPLRLYGMVLGPRAPACSECLVGDVFGVLDDGVGTGPDYVVQGEYQALVVSGRLQGSFRLTVRLPGGERAGWIAGRFDDPLGLETGTFQARTLLRR